jgi:hypothetical protein
MAGVAESEAERHRKTRGVRRGEQLLRLGSFAVFEPGQDTSEAGPGGVGADPCALTNHQLTRARLQIACPLSTAIAGRQGRLLSSSSRFSPVELGPGRGFIAAGKMGP